MCKTAESLAVSGKERKELWPLSGCLCECVAVCADVKALVLIEW